MTQWKHVFSKFKKKMIIKYFFVKKLTKSIIRNYFKYDQKNNGYEFVRGL